MRASHVDVLRTPVAIGRNIPVEVSSLARTVVSR
jgi:hypothetical protein